MQFIVVAKINATYYINSSIVTFNKDVCALEILL